MVRCLAVLVLVLYEIIQAISVTEYCPYTWDLWNGTCIHMIDGKSELPFQASNRCIDELGGHTLVIKNKEENDFFAEKFRFTSNKHVIPLGCIKSANNTRWVCREDGSIVGDWYNSSSNSGYWNWADGHPNVTEDADICLFLHGDGYWYDDLCDKQHQIIETCVRQPVTTSVKCPKSWQPLDNKCLLLLANYTRTSRELEKICGGQLGHLISIDSENQNSNITGALRTSKSSPRIWLGGSTRISKDGRWEWPDRSPFFTYWYNTTDYGGYWNWSRNEPAAGPGKMYMFLNATGSWSSSAVTSQTLTVVACEQGPTTVNCPLDYDPWKDMCLHVRLLNGSATDAVAACKAKDTGKPVVIENYSDNFFLGAQFQISNSSTEGMFIGCQDSYVEDAWVWTCTGLPSRELYWKDADNNTGYWNWMPGEPKVNNQTDCMVINSDGQYKSIPCAEEAAVLLACTHEAIEVAPTTEAPTTAAPTTSVHTTPTSTSTTQTQTVTSKPSTESTTISITTSSAKVPSTFATTNVVTMVTQNATTDTPIPHHHTLKVGAVVGIVVCVLLVLALVFVLGYAFYHPNSQAAICLSRIFGRYKNGSNVPYERAQTL